MTQMIRKILCPVDFSEASINAMGYADRLAVETGAELVLLHAFEVPVSLTMADIGNPSDPAIRPLLDSLLLTVADDRVTRVLHAGPAGEVICWMAEHQKCDVIVIGTHGRTGLTHLLLGSVTEYVMRHARCPVVTVRDRPAEEPPLTEPLVLPPKAPRFL